MKMSDEELVEAAKKLLEEEPSISRTQLLLRLGTKRERLEKLGVKLPMKMSNSESARRGKNSHKRGVWQSFRL